MELPIEAVILVVGGVLILARVGLDALLERNRLLTRVFDEAATQLGLHNSASGTDHPILRGQIRGLDVLVDCDQPSAFLVTVYAPGLPRAGVLSLARPRLDLGELEIVDGGLAYRVGKRPTAAEEIVKPVAGVLRAVERIRSTHVLGCLLEDVRQHTSADVRLKSLKALVDHYRRSPETDAALQVAVGDADPSIRHLAALEGEPERARGFLSDAANPPEQRLDVFERLARKLPYSELSAAVADVLACPDDRLRIRALHLVADARDRAHAPRIAALGKDASAELGRAVLETLVLLDACDEGALLPLLQCPSADVQRQAAKLLARCGSLRAVEPLLALEQSGGELEAAARDTIRTIQSRLAGAEAGGVSLVQAVPEGGISLLPEKEKC